MRKRLVALLASVVLIGAFGRPRAAGPPRRTRHKPAEVRTARRRGQGQAPSEAAQAVDAGSNANVTSSPPSPAIPGRPARCSQRRTWRRHARTARPRSSSAGSRSSSCPSWPARRTSSSSARPAQADRQAARQSRPGHRRAGPEHAALQGVLQAAQGQRSRTTTPRRSRATNFEAAQEARPPRRPTHDFAEAWTWATTGDRRQRLDPRRRHRLGPPRPDRHLADRPRPAGRRPTTRTTRWSCSVDPARSTWA